MPSLTLLLLSEAPREGAGWNVGASDGEAANSPRWEVRRRRVLAKKETEDKMATSKEEMYAKFQPWVLATYGDSAKTKTITVRKAARIRALLSTNEKVISENRFCVHEHRSDLDGMSVDQDDQSEETFEWKHFFKSSSLKHNSRQTLNPAAKKNKLLTRKI